MKADDDIDEPADPDYAALLRFRVALRTFNRWSEDQAARVGLTHTQHQLLLAIKGHADPRGPTIGDAAEYLLVRHNSAVELVSRVEALGLIERRADADDGRVVRLTLTRSGEDRIRQLTRIVLREVRSLARLLQSLTDTAGTPG
jgi:DNA-binding MarR family transcriptional regulator